MAASPPALWPCFKHKEVAGQTLMGTCHLNLCPTPSKYLTRYPTEDTLLNIPGHSCITFHRPMLARLGNVVYMGVLRTLSTIQTQNVVIRSKEAEMPRAHSLLSRYHTAHGVLQDSTPTGTNSWSLLGTSRSNCAGSLQASPTLCGTSQRVGRGTACSNHNPWKEQARLQQREELCGQVLSTTTGYLRRLKNFGNRCQPIAPGMHGGFSESLPPEDTVCGQGALLVSVTE